MRRSALCLGLVLVGCGSPSPPASPPPPPASATARAAPPPATIPLRLSDDDASPAFTDPARAEKIRALVPKLEKRIDDFFAKEKPPSIAVAMVADGKVVFTRVLGLRDRGKQEKATTKTLYRIGSITKTFTATLALSLRDAGLLELDVPAATYLPEFASVVYPTADAPKITVRHLLTHTSGFPRWGAFELRPDSDVTEAEVVASLAKGRLDHAPGTAFVYSNYGVSLAGIIAGRRSAEGALRPALAKHVTTPLGMTSTAFDPSLLQAPEVAIGYAKSSDPKPEPPLRLGGSEASGGLWSNIDDMTKWLVFQLGAWPARSGADGGPVARASLRESHLLGYPTAFDVHTEKGRLKGRHNGMGLGWRTATTCDYERLVEHSGAIDGFHSSFAFVPERDFGFVVLSNAIDADTDDLADFLLEEAAPVITARSPRLSKKTMALVEQLNAGLAKCDDSAYEPLFDAAFKKAVPKDRSLAICAKFTARHGACKVGAVVDVEGPHTGKLDLVCEKGSIRTWLNAMDENGSLRFDGLLISSRGLPAAKPVLAAAEGLLALRERWDAKQYAALFADPTHQEELRAAGERSKIESGTCKLAPDAAQKSGDGENGGTFALTCERGRPIELSLEVNDKGKVTSVNLRSALSLSAKPRCIAPK